MSVADSTETKLSDFNTRRDTEVELPESTIEILDWLSRSPQTHWDNREQVVQAAVADYLGFNDE